MGLKTRRKRCSSSMNIIPMNILASIIVMIEIVTSVIIAITMLTILIISIASDIIISIITIILITIYAMITAVLQVGLILQEVGGLPCQLPLEIPCLLF